MPRFTWRFPDMGLRSGMVFGLLGLVAQQAHAEGSDVDAKLTQTASAIEQALSHSDTMPGLVIGITDKHALVKVITYGYADIKTHAPVTPETRFAIGSISKAFTAISLMQLSEEGRFDPHAPITRYLPSFAVKSQFRPITGHDLMSHTSGLPNYLPDTASSRYAAIQLHDFTPTYEPGAHWWYSNTGFQLLGYVLEDIEHGVYTKIVRRRVLGRIGMTSTSPVIDDAERARMAVSYVRWPYDNSFVEAPWFEYSAGDGSLVATVGDMAAYVRFILNRGMGDEGRVLSEKSFAALTTPVLDNYAYGLFVKDGTIGHSGGIAGFHSHVEAHMEGGFGLVFLCNGMIDASLQKWVIEAVSAAYEGKPLPAAPAVVPEANPSDYVGMFGPLELKAPLEKMGPDIYRAPGDADTLPYVFERNQGKIISVSHGAQWYPAAGYTRPIKSAPKEYASYVGHFVNNGPEGPVARVFVRNGELMVLLSADESGEVMPLTPVGPNEFRIGEKSYSPERARFDSIVDGHALRLFVTGVPLYRKDIP
jgi:D-alanyl-D-alanine carboxypeptidase